MKNLQRLKDIIKILREPGGCDWDREQTPASMRPHLIEEAYEAVEAVNSSDREHAKEELGDLLYIIFFYARLFEEENFFDIDDIAEVISEKLVRRHPHVFGDVSVGGVSDILLNWEKIKGEEKEKKKPGSSQKGLLDKVDDFLPALHYAEKIQEKAASAGFDWPDVTGNIDKINEELLELSEAHKSEEHERIEEEMGDVLFAMVNLSRKMNVHPEVALRLASRKFINRFRIMEAEAERRGVDFLKTGLDEKEELWQAAKKNA